MQFLEKTLRDEPTTYYGRDSGVGLAIDYFDTLPSVRVGAIGLGTGTLGRLRHARTIASCSTKSIRRCRRLANEYFTYLGDARERMTHGDGQLDIVMGDARLSLERELNADKAPRGFHVLVVDAFSGDAIPTHLLTREAGDIYRRQLDPQGVLAIHISNRYLDLDPVVRGLADYLGFKVLRIDTTGDDDHRHVDGRLDASHAQRSLAQETRQGCNQTAGRAEVAAVDRRIQRLVADFEVTCGSCGTGNAVCQCERECGNELRINVRRRP